MTPAGVTHVPLSPSEQAAARASHLRAAGAEAVRQARTATEALLEDVVAPQLSGDTPVAHALRVLLQMANERQPPANRLSFDAFQQRVAEEMADGAGG